MQTQTNSGNIADFLAAIAQGLGADLGPPQIQGAPVQTQPIVIAPAAQQSAPAPSGDLQSIAILMVGAVLLAGVLK